MAIKSIIALLFLTTFFLAIQTPLSNGATVLGQNVAGLWVHGVVACSATGNLPGPGIPGVNVSVMCNGARTEPVVLAQLITDANGVFNALVTALDGIVFDQSTSPCQAVVQTPIAGCQLLAQPGLIRAAVTVAGNLIQTVLGLIAVTTIGLFQFVPI